MNEKAFLDYLNSNYVMVTNGMFAGMYEDMDSVMYNTPCTPMSVEDIYKEYKKTHKD